MKREHMLSAGILLLAATAHAQFGVIAPAPDEPADGSDLVLPASMPPLELMPTLERVGGLNGPLPEDLGRFVSFDPRTGEEARVLPTRSQAGHEPSAGIGASPGAFDDRNWISSTTPDPAAYPYRTTCKVAVRFDDNGIDRWISCSGTLIDASTLLISGPCLFDRASGLGWAEDVYVFPGWNGQGVITPPSTSAVIENYGFARGTSFAVGEAWFDDGLYTGAVGVVALDRAVGALTGWASYDSVPNAAGNTCRSYPSGTTCYDAGAQLLSRSLFFNPLPKDSRNYSGSPTFPRAAATTAPFPACSEPPSPAAPIPASSPSRTPCSTIGPTAPLPRSLGSRRALRLSSTRGSLNRGAACSISSR